jgi:hypothetical protein
MRVHQILASLLAGSSIIAPAFAEPVAARCKVERTINLGDSNLKAMLQPENRRANPSYDEIFVYDTATGRLCWADGSVRCVKTSDNTVETDGGIKATLSREGANMSGILNLRSDGRWVHQEGLIQTLGGKGDCIFGPPTDHQVALLTRNPDKDRDVLCAARLTVEAEILHAQGDSQLVQSILAWAQSLLDFTNNRGYNHEARSAAIKAEKASYAARDDAARAADLAICEARIAELRR